METEKKKIKTKFGDATISPNGYWVVTTNNTENQNKPLHRLVFEDFYKISLNEEFPEGVVIHHEDGNKLNNNIWNLVPMSKAEHRRVHNIGNTYNLGNIRSIKTKIKTSKSQNTTGYFRVCIMKKEGCKQGFLYRYNYYENGKSKSITSTKIDDLEEKVLARGLEWFKLKDVEAKI